jgi:Na+-translocating ferredoxin:NAD+ oxidoreductase subunit B
MSHRIIDTCTGCQACTKVCHTDAISGEKKGLHVINAQTCIDCGACGRICPFKAVLNEEEELCQMLKRPLWLQPLVTESKCVACGACIEVCPTGVLEFKARKGSNPNEVPYLADPRNCIGCSFCEGACPTHAIGMAVPVIH